MKFEYKTLFVISENENTDSDDFELSKITEYDMIYSVSKGFTPVVYFANKIIDIPLPILDDFLNFHYDKTDFQKEFLNVLKYQIPDFLTHYLNKLRLINDWVDRKNVTPSVSKPKPKKIIQVSNEKKNTPTTSKKYEKIKNRYKELTKIEGIKHDKAIEKLCKDFQCSEFTIDRALKKSN